MYSLFSNEKLGMPVEELRLREIRQEIEARGSGDEINPPQAGQFLDVPFIPKPLLTQKEEIYE